MRAIMLMFDSLNRHMLPPYGCDWVHAPNFQRLAERSVTFDKAYVGSMPCMPARRDLHTGRLNFLHRSWGPLEPFDDSVPQMLKEQGVSSHLITDHYHYFEDGGCNYHPRYSTWQCFRGHEGDPWIGQADPEPADGYAGRNAAAGNHEQDRINRKFMRREAEMPQSRTIDAGLDFIERNRHADNWFLQIETFDPHEPFFAPRSYKDRYAEHYRAYEDPVWDWPWYGPVRESAEEVEHMRYQYASLVSMCDAKLGDLLDAMDRHDMWEDTMLVVWTDHGFLLGEQESWAKMWCPWWEEKAHTPFFAWDPRSGRRNERRQALVQPSIDLGPTLLELFGLAPTDDMQGEPLRAAIADDTPVHETVIFGCHGSHVNITDGRYVYMRGTADESNEPLYEYTLMPTHMRSPFEPDELAGDKITLAEPFAFTKGCRVMRVPDSRRHPIVHPAQGRRTLLFDVEEDPGQRRPLDDEAVERRMVESLTAWMSHTDAPAEQYERLGLKSAGAPD